MRFLWFGKKQINKDLKVGIALGGGGTRGFAHIGVLKALKEIGVPIHYIAGTSVGAIMGAGYASCVDLTKLESFALAVKRKDVTSSKLFFSASPSDNLQELLGNFIGKDKLFSELAIPLAVVAVDIKTGSQIIIDHGFVCPACAASAAVPGIFKPVVWQDKHLVDGGLKNNVPADVCRMMGADVVIAIDVNSTRGAGTNSLKRFSLLYSTIGVLMQSIVVDKLKFADIALFPELSKFKSTKLDGAKEMIDIGYDCVMNNKKQILDLLMRKPNKRMRKLWQRKIQND